MNGQRSVHSRTKPDAFLVRMQLFEDHALQVLHLGRRCLHLPFYARLSPYSGLKLHCLLAQGTFAQDSESPYLGFKLYFLLAQAISTSDFELAQAISTRNSESLYFGLKLHCMWAQAISTQDSESPILGSSYIACWLKRIFLRL